MAAEHAVKSPEERLFEVSIDLLCVAGFDGYFKSINPAFENVLGYTREELLARPFIDFVHEDDRAATLAELAKLAEGSVTLHFENRYRCRDGTYRRLAWSAYPEPDANLVYAVARDVTVRKASDDKLSRTYAMLEALHRAQSRFIEGEDRHELFNGLLNSLLDLTDSEYGFIGEVIYGEDGRAHLKMHVITNLSWSEETQQLYDRTASLGMEFYNLDTLFGHVITERKPVISNNPSTDPRRGGLPPGHPELRAFLGLPFFKGTELIGVAGIANRPGGYDVGLVPFLQPFLSTCANLVEGFRNRQRREQAESALDRMARLDDLTGLPNRRAFIERLDLEIRRAHRYGTPLSLLTIDLDRFKQVNDTYGHAVGDEVLRGVAEILRSECRGTDYPGRIGGEEFVVFLTETDKGQAALVAQRVRQRVAEKHFFGADNKRFHITCSIGVATVSEHVDDTDKLLTIADQRLYEAKAQGRDRVCS
jgi:diguanylate cyclase (GGDEF)-like protein/PAS domain S-box-containing protein